MESDGAVGAASSEQAPCGVFMRFRKDQEEIIPL
jgi:hypothetical protein